MLRVQIALNSHRRRSILLVALVAFCLGQAMAIAHAARHVGDDAPGLPRDHAQLCTGCVSMLPLLTVAGGLGAALLIARPVAQSLVPTIEIRAVFTTVHRAFS